MTPLVDDPYIQAHLHGPSSRLVLARDDSPTVLRDEEGPRFKSCHPYHCSALSEHISIIALELVALPSWSCNAFTADSRWVRRID